MATRAILTYMIFGHVLQTNRTVCSFPFFLQYQCLDQIEQTPTVRGVPFLNLKFKHYEYDEIAASDIEEKQVMVAEAAKRVLLFLPNRIGLCRGSLRRT